MGIQTLIHKSLKLIKRNAPEILTGIGVGGVVATSYLSVKAGFRSVQVIEKEKEIFRRTGQTSFGTVPTEDQDELFTDWQMIQLLWKLYIPPVASGALTVICIVASQKSAGRRTAAAVAAYSISEKAFSEYKEKVIEQIGVGKEQKIRDQIAQDRVNNNPPISNQVIITGKGNVLFQEGYTGRYLRTDMEAMRKAVNDFNYILNHDQFLCLGEFYDLIGLDHTSISTDIGWDSNKQLELHFSAVVDQEAGEPCIVFSYVDFPKPIYD